MGNVEQIQLKVQQFLRNLGVTSVLEDTGARSVRHGSARCFIHVWSPRPDDPQVPAIIQLSIPLLSDVTETDELYQHIAFHADDYIFGHLSLGRDDFGRLNIHMTHHLLGESTTEGEFGRVLLSMLGTATDLDDALQADFGGSVFHT